MDPRIPYGYTRIRSAEGKKIGCSELAMHCGYAGHTAKMVYVNDRKTYAFVIMDNDKLAHGCYHNLHDELNLS